MSRATAVRCRHCHHAECQARSEKNPRLELEAQYTDKRHDIDLSLDIQSPSTITLDEFTKDVLDFLYLDDIPPEQVRLVGIDRGGRYQQLNVQNRQTTLEQLDVTHGCILFFEPTPNASPPNPCRLTIIGPDEVEKVDYEWYRAKTTLGMLLDYVIEIFSLESVGRERIHLFTIFRELEIFSYSDSRLSEFDLHDKMSVHVQIIPPLLPKIDDENKTIHVKCTCGKRKLNFDVENTKSIDDLKAKIEEQYENREVIDLELCNESNDKIDLNDPSRTLRSFGIRPGETISAKFSLITRSAKSSLVNTRTQTSTTTASSSSMKLKFANVTVICNFPSNNPETFQMPVTNSVSDLIEKVDTRKNTQRLDISKIYSETITIDFKKDHWRCLADLGFKRDDMINVNLVDKAPVHTSIVSKQSVSSSKPEPKPKDTRPKNFPIGLDNLGNSCYMNSALQCLARVPPLTAFFMQGFKNAHMDDGEHTDNDYNPFDTIGDVTGAYADLLWRLLKSDENGDDYTSFKPTRIKEAIGSKDVRFATDDQQDAQEFMTYILDVIHEELKAKDKNSRHTIINDLFFGALKSTITCTECQKEESTIQPINFLSIPLNRQERKFWINFIPKTGKEELKSIDMPINSLVENVVDEFSILYSKPSLFYYILVLLADGEVDLKTPLSEIPTDEFIFLENEDKLRESRPERLKISQKRLTLSDCLTDFFSAEELQDGWNCSQPTCRKKTTATKQLTLSTLPNVLIIQFKRFSHENGLRQKVETLVNYPLQDLDLKQCLPRLQESAIYDLCAVSHHMGSIHGGHYTACARHIKGNKTEWYTFDDAFVSRVKPDDYQWDIVSRNAYLLFYVKRGIQTTV
jgi:ubiquitin C-terminal hydrolase